MMKIISAADDVLNGDSCDAVVRPGCRENARAASRHRCAAEAACVVVNSQGHLGNAGHEHFAALLGATLSGHTSCY